jgi:hypothetical protein
MNKMEIEIVGGGAETIVSGAIPPEAVTQFTFFKSGVFLFGVENDRKGKAGLGARIELFVSKEGVFHHQSEVAVSHTGLQNIIAVNSFSPVIFKGEGEGDGKVEIISRCLRQEEV